MAAKFTGSTIAVALVAAAVGAGITLAVVRLTTTSPERTPDGKPDFSGSGRRSMKRTGIRGLRGATGRRHAGVYPWSMRAAAGAVWRSASLAAFGSVGVSGRLFRLPEAVTVMKENGENWIDRDPG
jgi:hypothetical protein